MHNAPRNCHLPKHPELLGKLRRRNRSWPVLLKSTSACLGWLPALSLESHGVWRIAQRSRAVLIQCNVLCNGGRPSEGTHACHELRTYVRTEVQVFVDICAVTDNSVCVCQIDAILTSYKNARPGFWSASKPAKATHTMEPRGHVGIYQFA